jgi:hypothetical protein
MQTETNADARMNSSDDEKTDDEGSGTAEA